MISHLLRSLLRVCTHEPSGYLRGPRSIPEGPSHVLAYLEDCERCNAYRTVFRLKEPTGPHDPIPYPPGPWMWGWCLWKQEGEPGGWDVWIVRSLREARQIEARARTGVGIAYNRVVRHGWLVAARLNQLGTEIRP